MNHIEEKYILALKDLLYDYSLRAPQIGQGIGESWKETHRLAEEALVAIIVSLSSRNGIMEPLSDEDEPHCDYAERRYPHNEFQEQSLGKFTSDAVTLALRKACVDTLTERPLCVHRETMQKLANTLKIVADLPVNDYPTDDDDDSLRVHVEHAYLEACEDLEMIASQYGITPTEE